MEHVQQNLYDHLLQLTKGNSFVANFGRKFKGICDKLSTIGQLVNDTHMIHYFLCGLRPSFETFSITIWASKPTLSFRDLLAQGESHELFF